MPTARPTPQRATKPGRPHAPHPGHQLPAEPAAKQPPLHPFDRSHGTDTGGLIPGPALASGHPHDRYITAYYAVAPSILDTLIDLWLRTPPTFPIDRYTLLDVGAGKGRAMLTASQHPFRQVTGIEINPDLAAIARANIQRFARSPRAHPLAPVDLIEGDALAVPLPQTPTVALLFHPFELPVLRGFLAHLVQHFAGRPGSLDLLYINAEHTGLLDRSPALTRLFHGMVPMSAEDHRADLAEIAEQKEYGSTGDELCTIYRL